MKTEKSVEEEPKDKESPNTCPGEEIVVKTEDADVLTSDIELTISSELEIEIETEQDVDKSSPASPSIPETVSDVTTSNPEVGTMESSRVESEGMLYAPEIFVDSQVLTCVKPCIIEKATQTVEELDSPDEHDYSVLQPPLNLGVKNVKQILTCIKSGSLEVQDIIFNECNIIYECKVCHNLFRCLANLLSHKRFYCKDPYSKVYEIGLNKAQSDVTVVIEPESPPEQEEEEALDVTSQADGGTADLDAPMQNEIQFSTPKIFTPPKENRPFAREHIVEECRDETFIHLEHIRGNANAVFQTVIETSDKMDDSATLSNDKTNEDGHENNNTGAVANTIVVTREQKLMKRSDCSIKDLTCLKCQMRFDTLKGLYVHMMTIHANKQVYYPCIYCKTSFLQLYGVSRHMMKVHRKTKEQVARIRDLVKKRAFICKGQPSSELIARNQSQKLEVVVAPKLHSCSKCNRQFERKSSQISHEKFCRFGTSMPEPQSHKKAPGAPIIHNCIKCGRSFKLKSSQISHTKFCKGITLQKPTTKVVIKPPKPPRKAAVPVKITPLVVKHAIHEQEDSSRPKRDAKKKFFDEDFVSSQSLKWRSANKVESVSRAKANVSPPKDANPKVFKIPPSTKKPPMVIIKKPDVTSTPVQLQTQGKLSPPIKNVSSQTGVTQPAKPSSQARQQSSQIKSASQLKASLPAKQSPSLLLKTQQRAKVTPVNIIEGRVYSIINALKLSCLKCNRRFSTFSNLRRHAATHIGWMRFKCKHCSYQCFNRSDCRSHIQRMHAGTYTNAGNIDKNIIKLASGKLSVRQKDLLSDGVGRLPTKTSSSQETKQCTVSKSPQDVKPAKTVLSKVPQDVKPPKTVLSKVSQDIKPPKTVISKVSQDVKPPKNVSSIIVKKEPSEEPSFKPPVPALITKVSPKKPKEVIEVKVPKPVTSLVLRTVSPGSQDAPITKQAPCARKSTGGVSKKVLKNLAIATPLTVTPKIKAVSPSSPIVKPVERTSPPPQPHYMFQMKLSTLKNEQTPPKIVKVTEVNPATTKPHVILLNSSRGKPDSEPTLVTRGGTYTKSILALKVPVKTSEKVRNGIASTENNQSPSKQLLDHQYT